MMSDDQQIIKASGTYDIDMALYELEEYPDDFESDDNEVAEEDGQELTQIIQNYKQMLNEDMGQSASTWKESTSDGV